MAHGYVPYDPSVRRKELYQFGGFCAVWCVLSSFVFASMAEKEWQSAWYSMRIDDARAHTLWPKSTNFKIRQTIEFQQRLRSFLQSGSDITLPLMGATYRRKQGQRGMSVSLAKVVKAAQILKLQLWRSQHGEGLRTTVAICHTS